ncbi:MAG TPA: hypothetical protein VE007_05415 [Thermoanaerobaculia bacterium]|nr:hypothetical protein [Thermoanaerobaculia bacterium]
MRTVPTLAVVSFACASAVALAQHSPAPDRPAEGPLRANPGAGPAPGVHPPAPMDGNRFAPGPPPQPTEESPRGRVKTVETVTVPTPGATPGVSPAPTRAAAVSPAATPAPTPSKAMTKKAKRTTKRTPRPAVTPAATPRAS